MQALYIHVPYCSHLCPYCDFNRYIKGHRPWQQLIQAYLRELEERWPLFAQKPSNWQIQTIYLGGGTPSLMPLVDLQQLFEGIKALVDVSKEAEITIEVDPKDVLSLDMACLRQLGINRCSMGVQSLDDQSLKIIDRQHDSQQALAAYSHLRHAGIANISLDMMYALPKQGLVDVACDIQKMLALEPEHLSVYELTYHTQTPFGKALKRNPSMKPPEDTEAAMYEVIVAALQSHGYRHYEVSNFCKPGYEARHNRMYWQMADCLALGPGAHSFYKCHEDEGYRWENVRRPEAYMHFWNSKQRPSLLREGEKASAWQLPIPLAEDGSVSFVEQLGQQALWMETLACAMRTSEGLDLQNPHLLRQPSAFWQEVDLLCQQQLLLKTDRRLRPSPQGLRLADTLAYKLLL